MESTAVVTKQEYMPSTGARRILAGMAAALEKTPIRNYAGVIGIRAGSAYLTDGFALMRWTAGEFAGVDASLGRDLYPSSVRFPAADSVISTEMPTKLESGADIAALVSRLRAAKSGDPELFLAIAKGSGRASLVVRADLPAETHWLFNPYVVGRYMRALPKGAELTSAEIRGDQLHLHYADGEFLLLALRVRSSAED